MVTVDKSGANTAALATLNADKPDEKTISIRQSKYLNNLVERDHRNIKRLKRLIRLMLGFNSFRRSKTILAGIELIHMIRKGQYRHLQGDGLSPAEQFYLLVAWIKVSATSAVPLPLMRQNHQMLYKFSQSFLPGGLISV